MLLLGIDVGTSSIKVSVVDAETGKAIASAHYPETETDIITPQPGWAEQSPELWWEHTRQAILKCNAGKMFNPWDIGAIGIAYQMHGLVMVDRDQNVLRNAIIWCDGRAVKMGEDAFDAMGHEYCLSHLLNSPSNFTAAKLAWVKENEPGVYSRIYKAMLPGDFISMKLTGEITTTASALSEGILWDFTENSVSSAIMSHFGFDQQIVPDARPLFSTHGFLRKDVAALLGLKPAIPVSYKAGDQLNNAFSLNVLEPGEVAATAGTSGVIYAVSDKLAYDPQSRINSFAHVNHTPDKVRTGILLCINGAGIFNRWIRNAMGGHSYESINAAAAKVSPGSNGLCVLPFGNGAERMLNNRMVGAHMHNIDLNVHEAGHLARAVQEGIAFSFRYGLDIMRENGVHPMIIRAGRTNMFLSDVFVESFVNATGISVELYETDGGAGAAIGAGVGINWYHSVTEAFHNRTPARIVQPGNSLENYYQDWRKALELHLRMDGRHAFLNS